MVNGEAMSRDALRAGDLVVAPDVAPAVVALDVAPAVGADVE